MQKVKKDYKAPFLEMEEIDLEDVILESESTTETPQGTRPGIDLDPDEF